MVSPSTVMALEVLMFWVSGTVPFSVGVTAPEDVATSAAGPQQGLHGLQGFQQPQLEPLLSTSCSAPLLQQQGFAHGLQPQPLLPLPLVAALPGTDPQGPL